MKSMTPEKRRWLALAGLVAVPLYVLPVGFFGVRGLWPRVLRDAATGAIALGFVSLVGMSLTGRARLRATGGPNDDERWRLPSFGQVTPEEFAASAASGH